MSDDVRDSDYVVVANEEKDIPVPIKAYKDQSIPVNLASSVLPIRIGGRYKLLSFSVNKNSSDNIINGTYDVRDIKGNWIETKLVSEIERPWEWFNTNALIVIVPQ